MTSRPSTAVLAAIAELILEPVIHFATDYSKLSTSLFASQPWNLPSASPRVNPPPLELSRADELLYTVGNTEYFSPVARPIASFPFVADSDSEARFHGHRPVTVIRVPLYLTVIDPDVLQHLIEKAPAADDFLNEAFLETVILLPQLETSGSSTTTALLQVEALRMLVNTYRVKQVYVDPTVYLPRKVQLYDVGLEVHRLFPPLMTVPDLNGPRLAAFHQNEEVVDLYPVYRLYSDRNRAFLYGIYPSVGPRDSEETWKAFWHVDHLGYNLIPVPSRLFTFDRSNGVAGQRIAVKDLYDIKGVPTDAGSRAYGELYGAANETAVAVKRLTSLGAHLVGKTKTAAFAIGSRGHGDTVDEQYPFSPRGDGWKTAGGSSSGSAVAMSAYGWLDFAIGSDTTGSMRGPAALTGLYGNRPTTGIINMTGVIPLHAYSDTPGDFARSPDSFAAFLRAWYGEPLLKTGRHSGLPISIRAADEYLMEANPEAQTVIDSFIQQLEEKMQLQVTHFGLDATMSEAGYTESTLDSMTEGFRQAIFCRFRGDYSSAHEGRRPLLDPGVRHQWDQAEASMSWDKYRANMRTVQEFKTWFNGHVLLSNETTCSQSIMLIALGSGGEPGYREDELNKGAFHRDTNLLSADLSSLTGGVDYTIPIGQVEYTSEVTKVREKKAVSINLMAHPGCE